MTAHRVLSQHPLNSEPPPADLIAGGFHTKDALVYHRNHGELVNIDPTTYSLTLSSPEGLFNLTTHDLKLDDVKAFAKEQVEGLLMCAGNRRVEMNEEQKVEGLCWDRSALANAQWGGALLRNVLVDWGVSPEGPFEGLHCHFEADQACDDDSFFGASIPLSLAMDTAVPALLAYEMNGELLPAEHGGPLRVFVPGVIGARSCKWVQRILIKTTESECFYQTKDYKILPPQATAETKEKYMKETDAMLQFSMNTAICSPESGAHIRLSPTSSAIEVAGYAYGSNGTPLCHVFIALLPCSSSSTVASLHSDAGKLSPSSWTAARLETGDSAPRADGKNYAWTLWKVGLEVPGLTVGGVEEKDVALVAFCEDVEGNKQPLETPWNLRGLGETSWSVVKVK
ncbi:Oxidoreductase, molybdopterin-binding domain-containing protein, partial [Leucosporidium creatinivorum]